MIVTVNTDASWDNGYAGYAFWIVCDAGKIQKGAYFKDLVNGPSEAELMCIANALHTLKHSRFKDITKVIINTDLMAASYILTPTRKLSKLDHLHKESLFLMCDIAVKNGYNSKHIYEMFEIRHVKAHTKNKDARSYVNNWCDKEAKKYMRIRKTLSI